MFIIFLALIALWGAPVNAQQRGSEKEWNDTIAAGRGEGKVVIATLPDPAMREIAAKFKARFGILLEHLAGSSNQLGAAIEVARQNGY